VSEETIRIGLRIIAVASIFVFFGVASWLSERAHKKGESTRWG
jgi:hypothetical protein